MTDLNKCSFLGFFKNAVRLFSVEGLCRTTCSSDEERLIISRFAVIFMNHKAYVTNTYLISVKPEGNSIFT